MSVGGAFTILFIFALITFIFHMKNSNRSNDPSNKLVDRTHLSCNQKIGMDTFKVGHGSSTESLDTSLPAYISCLVPCNNLPSLPPKCYYY